MGQGMTAAGMAAAMLAAGTLHAQTAPQDPPVQAPPMQPSGKWVAEFEESVCVLSRSYGTGPAAVQLAFRPIPGDTYIEIVVLMPHGGKDHNRTGAAETRLFPGGQRSVGEVWDYTVKGLRLWRVKATRDELSNLATARTIQLAPADGSEPPRAFALTGTARALETIRTCEDDLVRRWGFDPEMLRGLRTRAEPVTSPQYWVTNQDYPSEALSRGIQGSVRFRLTVDEQGRAIDCNLNQSSGSDLLDKVSCKLLLKRARFKPAIGADGKPVRVPWNSTFVFRLPSPGER